MSKGRQRAVASALGRLDRRKIVGFGVTLSIGTDILL
jgi:hypothetical protein